MGVSHVYQVPFLGSGHAVNMFNVGTVLANEDTQVHVLVPSLQKANRWLKATGQGPNPHLHIVVLANGKWEDWDRHDAPGIFQLVLSPEFNSAIGEAIEANKKRFPGDAHTAIIFNGLMNAVADMALEKGLKGLILGPTPYYMTAFTTKQLPDRSTKPTDPIVLKGIAGSDKDLHAVFGDAIDLLGDMYHKMFKPSAEKCVGMIWSNTNEGLEGSDPRQSHMKDYEKVLHAYFIGPILPPLYYRALDDADALQRQLASADQSDPCIAFLNKHPPRSVVYVALGSHAEFELEQALTVIKMLRKYEQPWVFLQHTDTEALEKVVGEHPDGVITPWAPQLEVLLHPSTKCVLSHGGFGTMIEGVFAGQPFITSPVMSDQFIDTKVMQHLGICVGTVAENRFQSAMQRPKISPLWPDDGGKLIDEVFAHAFGPGGDEVLANARKASRALRVRMVNAKETQGVEALKKLRADLATPA